MMLADRRVAGAGRRRPLSSCARPLCLVAVLLLDPASATAAARSRSGARRGRPRVSVVRSGGGGVGVATASPWGITGKVVRTAVMGAAATVQDDGCGRPLPTAAALADPSSKATVRERAKRLAIRIRGGSEGLKSEEWNREKAAEGEAARAREPSCAVGKVGNQGARFAQDSSSSSSVISISSHTAAARNMSQSGVGVPTPRPAGIGAEVEEAGRVVHRDRIIAAKLGADLRERKNGDGAGTKAPVEDRFGRGGQGQGAMLSAAVRLEAQEGEDGRRGKKRVDSPGLGLHQKEDEDQRGDKGESAGESDQRRLCADSEGVAKSAGDGTAVAAAAGAAPGDVWGQKPLESRGSGEQEGLASAQAIKPTAAAREVPPSGRRLSAGGSPMAAAGSSDVGRDGGGDGNAGALRFSAVGVTSSGGATTTVRRRRAANETKKSASGGWKRNPVPRVAPNGAGAVAHAEYLPRAGAPPPPRGEINVWRPWGRHGAAALPSTAGAGGGSNGAEAAVTPVVGIIGAGGDVAAAAVAVTEGERGREGGGEGGDAAAGEGAGKGGKVRRMRWEPKYLTVKAVFFLFYSSLGAIMPYLPVYYHTLGIPDRRIGHLGAITPAMTFIFTPLWGALTDKSGMLKQILVLTFAASTLLRVSLPSRTSFLWIISIITMTAIINAPVRPLLDSSALQSLDDRGEYGKQRLWGQWGFGIGSFLTGKLLSRFGFKAAFYMHAAFSVPTLLILLRFSPKKEDKGKEPPKFGELYRLVVHDVDVLVFFSMVFAIGLSSGVIENFAYKRLRELGGTGSVLGVSRLISSLSGIPMFFFSGAIVKHFSIVGILTASMMSFIARFVIYACIKNPWAGLPAEALRGVTFAGFWAASTCHVGAIAPPGLSTTMLGLLNATYGGIGQSLGSLIGGSLSNSFGTARAFLVYAGVDTCLLLAFFLFWGLHPNGQQKDRGAGGGIGSCSPGVPAVRKISVPAVQPPPAATAAATPVAPPSQDQTFSPPSPPPGGAPR
eukprot:g5135.t1